VGHSSNTGKPVVARNAVPQLWACDAHVPALLGPLRLRPGMATSRGAPLGAPGLFSEPGGLNSSPRHKRRDFRRAPGGEHPLIAAVSMGRRNTSWFEELRCSWLSEVLVGGRR
jgi:hypothetical protein